MLDRVQSLHRLLVLNDEAHHVHDEELVWNQTLVNLHETLPHGLSAWLDLGNAAVPGWRSLPWIVCDDYLKPSGAIGGYFPDWVAV